MPQGQVFDGELTIHHGQHDMPVDRLHCPVNHDQIAVIDPGVFHRKTRHPHHKGRLGVLDELGRQVKPRSAKVLCRRRKARLHAPQGLRQEHGQAIRWHGMCGQLNTVHIFSI